MKLILLIVVDGETASVTQKVDRTTASVPVTDGEKSFLQTRDMKDVLQKYVNAIGSAEGILEKNLDSATLCATDLSTSSGFNNGVKRFRTFHKVGNERRHVGAATTVDEPVSDVGDRAGTFWVWVDNDVVGGNWGGTGDTSKTGTATG